MRKVVRIKNKKPIPAALMRQVMKPSDNGMVTLKTFNKRVRALKAKKKHCKSGKKY